MVAKLVMILTINIPKADHQNHAQADTGGNANIPAPMAPPTTRKIPWLKGLDEWEDKL